MMSDTESEAGPEPSKAAPAGSGRLEEAILRLAGQYGPGKSFSPSEVAASLSDEWRPLLGPLRAAACRLAEEGRIDILRHGKPIVPAAMKGVVRLRLKQG